MALAGNVEIPDHHHGWGCYSGHRSCYGGWSYGGWCGYRHNRCYYPAYYPIYLNNYYSTYPVAAPGNIVVSMPAGAKLTIDGYVSMQTSTTRQFATPALQPGVNYTYTLVAEIPENGQLLQQTQIVTVRAGQTTAVSFTFGPAATTISR
jgi:uncharacterized protein (TIGR03000 family)